jgi:hypothetical protein
VGSDVEIEVLWRQSRYVGCLPRKESHIEGYSMEDPGGLFFESRSKPKANPAVPDKRVESTIIAGTCNETMGILKIISVRQPILDCHATYKISVFIIAWTSGLWRSSDLRRRNP